MNVTRLDTAVKAGSPFGFRPVIFLGLVSALMVQGQQAYPPIQFNDPYRCADGITYVIERCESRAKGDVCFFHIEANGQRESDRYMARSQFTDMLKRCPVSAASKPAAPPAATATPNRPTDTPNQKDMELLLRQIQEAARRQQGNSPVASNNARTAAKPAVPAVGPPDPGIVKARTANVDTKLFGIPLGEPLVLPKCTGGLLAPPPSTNCIEDHAVLEGLAAAIVGEAKPDPGAPTGATIQLTTDYCPTWLEGCSFDATIQNGRFVAAVLKTKGRDVQAAVGKELRGKYGQRASMQQRFITPNNGGAKFEVWDLDWEFPGLHVDYKVVNSTILDGFVRIESETIYKARKAQEREAARPKM